MPVPRQASLRRAVRMSECDDEGRRFGLLENVLSTGHARSELIIRSLEII